MRSTALNPPNLKTKVTLLFGRVKSDGEGSEVHGGRNMRICDKAVLEK